jgi:Integron cassette protein VCH_CASS1 chain
MPRTITDVDILQEYISGVMDRADHHAGNVIEVALAIAGAVIWRKDGDIQVYEREGQMANALWVPINGTRYAISYNHLADVIEIREGSMRGVTLASFDNSNTAAEVRGFFESL